jgi:succinate dehydrogenase/fumarate reductase cytochrome b subunit
VAAAFIVFAFCNPWTEGPGVLRWTLVSPERFTALYSDYFTLSDLGIGRLLNLAVSLPVGYAALSALWRIARPFGTVFITLGQQSLGAFVLHVYAILVMAHIPSEDGIWRNTLLQLTAILTIAALLYGIRRLSLRRRPATSPLPRPLAA